MMHLRSAFGRDKNSPSGLTYACKAVVVTRNNLSHTKSREANNIRHANDRLARKRSPDRAKWVVRKLLSDALQRAKNRGINFEISASDIETPNVCPVFGTTLIYQADEKRKDESASLDRINSRLGYIPGNVWVISWRANQIKSDATPDEMRLVADAVEERLSKKRAGALLDGIEHKAMPNV